MWRGVLCMPASKAFELFHIQIWLTIQMVLKVYLRNITVYISLNCRTNWIKSFGGCRYIYYFMFPGYREVTNKLFSSFRIVWGASLGSHATLKNVFFFYSRRKKSYQCSHKGLHVIHIAFSMQYFAKCEFSQPFF